ncbi:hypothetical protein [Ralstonia pseudosolanacearum]|uniref:hypothetical protein n=1 Tax=Ralstonia pseudosolanacearum TaxID=1310165 RepID=UPI0018D1F22D|nr:hypothetical protein [Ralstonia pseudosolanacearum]
MVVWFGLVWFGLVWFGLVWFGLVWFGLVWFGLVLVVHPVFRPLPGPTHFLCLAKESKQRKARPRWRPPP